MTEFNVIQSATWPFEEYHSDIPQGLFADAHVISADSAALNAVTVSSGSIFVALTVTKDNVRTEVSSGTVQLDRNRKVKFYNAVGKCFGWLLTGDVLPATLAIQNVSYNLAGTVCLPVDGYVPANDTGMTGEWEVIGEDGITVTPGLDDSTGNLNLAVGTDESWFAVEDPNYEMKTEGEGIWTLNGLAGDIKLKLADGKIFPEQVVRRELAHGVIWLQEGALLGLEFVPDLVFFSDRADGSVKTHVVFKAGADDHTWNQVNGQGSVTESNGTFIVTVDGTVRTMRINTTYAWRLYDVPYLERLAIRWAGCPDSDPFREFIKTSWETGDRTAFPLDGVLNGTVNG